MHRTARIAPLLTCESETEFYRTFISTFREPASVVPGVAEPATIFAGDAALPSGSSLDRMMCLDLMAYLPDDILVKVDRAAMSGGLETRAPFLDHDVIAFAWRLPDGARRRGGEGKWLLRELLRQYLPSSLVDRPKMGFAAPIGTWLRGPLREWMNDLLSPERIRRTGLLDPSAVEQMRRAAQRGITTWDSQLWTLLMFESWREAHRSIEAVAA